MADRSALAKQLVAQKLGPSFGQGGDFSVVVEDGVDGVVAAAPGDANSNGAGGDGTDGGVLAAFQLRKTLEFSGFVTGSGGGPNVWGW